MNKMDKATYMNPVRFMFSDDKKVQGVLSAEFGEGWETSLPVVDMVRGLEQEGCCVICCHVTVM